MKTSPVKTCCAVQCSNHIPAESKRIKYCSKGCANKVANSQRWKRKSIRLKRKRQIKRDGFQPETLVCEQCGKEYATSYLRQVSKTCSKPCSSLRRKIIKNRHKQKLKSRTRRNSIHHKIKDRLSSRLREVLKQRGLKKASPTTANFGCSPEELRKHLESQFKDGMSWGNYGVMGWHIDHIVPLSKGGTNDFGNLQLLCPTCNLNKHAKDPVDFMQSKGYLL